MTTSKIKTVVLTLSALAAVGAFVIFTLWRTSPNRLGEEAFRNTGLPTRTLTEAMELAKAQGKPLLVDISAYWCPTCRKLDREVLSKEEVKSKIVEKYVFVRVDSEADGTRSIMKRYGVYGFPSLIITDAEGNLIRHLPLTFDPQAFLQAL